MGYFGKEALDELTKGRAELQPALRKLKAAYAGRTYAKDQAREYAQHGLCRRLSAMVHAIETVFELLPPDLDAIPELVTVMDATACIQNFVMNAFGCLENLAWIWVLEKNVRGKAGAELGRHDVGLGKPYVKKSFSPEFKAFLDGNRDWLGNLISFRDGLAHRIPLYIAPYVIEEAAAEQHKTLGVAAIAAGIRRQSGRVRPPPGRTAGARPLPAVDDPFGVRRRAYHHLPQTDAAGLRDGRRLRLDADRGIRALSRPLPVVGSGRSRKRAALPRSRSGSGSCPGGAQSSCARAVPNIRSVLVRRRHVVFGQFHLQTQAVQPGAAVPEFRAPQEHELELPGD